MKEEKSLTPYNLLNEKKQAIIDQWLRELHENPRFSQQPLCQNEHLQEISQQFFNKLLVAVDSDNFPAVNLKNLEPVFKIWHDILRNQSDLGFTTKDTAMLIFSLKNSLLQYLKNQSEEEKLSHDSKVNKFAYLLDMLGLLTFEIYTVEKEKLITRQSEQIHYLQHNQSELRFKELVGSSHQMNMVYKAIGLVLENDITVLLEGESGTGKDVIANIIHQNSKRKDNPFVVVNCGAIPKDLVESELFGHERGAFTGAEARRLGKFELAHGGTLFLDEVGELPQDVQVKLLRAIQNREIERVGGNEKIKVDVRIIAATNKNLNEEVKKGRFRLDLYYRLNVYPIHIPPLRERPDDIVPLAYHFLKLYAAQFRTSAKVLSDDAEKYLLQQKWEGNIRELENLMQRAAVLTQGEVVTSLVLQIHPGKPETLLKELPGLPAASKRALAETTNNHTIIPLEEVEKNAISQALKIKNNNIRQVAKALGLSRTTLYNKITKYKIPMEQTGE